MCIRDSDTIVWLVAGDTIVWLVAGDTIVWLVAGDTIVWLVAGDTIVWLVAGDTIVWLVAGDTIVWLVDWSLTNGDDCCSSRSIRGLPSVNCLDFSFKGGFGMAEIELFD